MAKYYKNIYKNEAYELFLEKKGEFYNGDSPISRKDFQKFYWNYALKYARTEGLLNLASKEYSKNTKILIKEYLEYGNSRLKNYMELENENLPFSKRFDMVDIHTSIGRFNRFLEEFGQEKINGSTLENWFLLWKDGFISKEEFYDIIKNFKDSPAFATEIYKNKGETANSQDYMHR